MSYARDLADELAAEQARHAEVIRKLAAQDPFEIKPGERISVPIASLAPRP